MKNLKKLVFILIFTLSFLVLTACGKKYHVYRLPLGDSFNTVSLVQIATLQDKSDEELTTLRDELDNILIDLDKLFNVHIREQTGITDLMKINQNAGIAPVKVDGEVIFVLKKALEMSEFSLVDGRALFDPTIAPIWNEWDFVNNVYNPYFDNIEEIPTGEKIHELLNLVDYKNIEIDEVNQTVFLKNKGMELDLGAIVKGYAADKLKSHLISKGYTKAVIDVGRNILLLGDYFNDKAEDVPWKVSLQTPYISHYDDSDISIFGKIFVSDATVVTTGIYEKYIMDKDGNTYHHILDPRTGYPFDNKVISVSVICKESIIGDGFSTTLFALGIDKGMNLVNQLDYVETIWVIENGDNKEVYISNGLVDNFEFNTNVEKLGYVYKGVYNANTTNK